MDSYIVCPLATSLVQHAQLSKVFYKLYIGQHPCDLFFSLYFFLSTRTSYSTIYVVCPSVPSATIFLLLLLLLLFLLLLLLFCHPWSPCWWPHARHPGCCCCWGVSLCGGSFARCRLIRMIIYKRLVPLEDYLQGGPFARGWPIWKIICKRPAPFVW